MSLTTGDISLLLRTAKSQRRDPVAFIAKRLCITQTEAEAMVKQARNAERSEASNGR